MKEGLGIVIIDQCTTADGGLQTIKVIAIEKPTVFETCVTVKANRLFSRDAASFITALRAEMAAMSRANPSSVIELKRQHHDSERVKTGCCVEVHAAV